MNSTHASPSGSNFDGSYKCGIAISAEAQDFWSKHLAAQGYDFTAKSLAPTTMLLTVAIAPANLQNFRAFVSSIQYEWNRIKKERK